jgi:hypothetical protein
MNSEILYRRWAISLAVAATVSLTHARFADAQDTAVVRRPVDSLVRVDSASDSTVKSPATGAAKTTSKAAKKSAKRAATKPRAPEPVWPVKGPDPLPGALLPNKRIIAYYGNPLSKRMGILGELPPDDMLAKLQKEAAAWEAADPATPVVKALHLIAIVAQGSPGRDGKYRLLMDSALIERVYGWAQKAGALLFLDVQVGQSTLQQELPRLARYLKRPDVHLGIDPEFSMNYGSKGRVPGSRIGTFDAADVNYAVRFLSDLAAENNLPPKVLVVHRFTRTMVTNTHKIELDPRVQVVIDMDGWGPPFLKRDSYRDYVYRYPVQFTGFKLFYKNDTKKGHPLMKPEDVLALFPKPVYIQYQ